MNYNELFDYAAQPKETVIRCNLCGSTEFTIEAREERYGFPVGVATCQCGLVFFEPRMTKEAYARFYAAGTYRKLVSAYHGREINADTIQAEQRGYAWKLFDLLDSFGFSGGSLLDIGGSTGVVAGVVSEWFGLKPTVLEPAGDEADRAEKRGIKVLRGTIEEFQPGEERFDLILLCQTVDHLLDITGALRKIRSCLSEHGLFFVDIVDFGVTQEVKIDHPYNLTPATMREYLRRTGFTVLREGRTNDDVHVWYMCGGAA